MKKQFFIICTATLLFTSCQKQAVNHFAGSALGTTYTVTYTGKESSHLKNQTDSILQIINHEFSVFDSTSLLSQINMGKDIALNSDFVHVLTQSIQIGAKTNGAFDCTLQPLLELWGFGRAQHKQIVPPKTIDSVKQFVGYRLIAIDKNHLIKKDARVQLNFNAIAKGYAVDKIAALFLEKGYPNFVIEVGGEIVAKGTKKGKPWKIGIQVPTETADGAQESQNSFELTDMAVATSGNYRNYFEKNGVRYTHILNPQTGRPEQSNLLSVSIIANDCMTADAYATAFMVLGLDKAMQLAETIPNLEAFFIYDDHGQYKTAKTPNFP